MGRAEDIFDRIVSQGEPAIDDFIADRQSEELFLDFKQSADGGKGRKLHDTDRQNLSKAVSGFGNSEGGVIVWGVDCRDDASLGDVAKCKVPIENPKRFVSRLEGAVSGCTIPAHPHVRHHAVESGSLNTGFVITHVPKSYLAPHQTVGRLQYFIRTGSDFAPAPHGVLSGLFGRHPQPVVFPMWAISGPEIKEDAMIHVGIGLLLHNQGPVVAREVYANLTVFRPRGPSRVLCENMEPSNWFNHAPLEHMKHFIVNESFRLAPGATTQPFTMNFYLKPPFESELRYEISFGHQNGPMQKLIATVEPDRIKRAYLLFIAGQGAPSNETKKAFMDEVFPLKPEQGNDSRDNSPLGDTLPLLPPPG